MRHLFLLSFCFVSLLPFVTGGCAKRDPNHSEKKGYRDPEFPALVSSYTDSCGKVHYSFKSALTVSNLIENVQRFSARGQKSIESRYFFYIHLGYDDLLELYSRLRQLPASDLTSVLIFDLRDYFLRLSIGDPGARTFFASALNQERNLIQGVFQSEFLSIVDSAECPMTKLSRAEIVANTAHFQNRQAGLRVFHAAMEAPNFKVGGVGSYLAGLVPAEKNSPHNIRPALLTPFYDLLKKKYHNTAEYVGYVDHEVESQVYRSTVYKVTENGVDQYLIQPDLGYRWNLFNIQEASSLYEKFDDEKWIYFSSALASVAALYHGGSYQDHVDVLQINDWHLGLAAAVLDEALNPKRQNAGLRTVAIVATTHEVNQYQGQDHGSFIFKNVGLSQPPTLQANLQAAFQIFSDASNTVSKAVAEEMASPDTSLSFGLGELFDSLARLGRFVGITNGIDAQRFDPTQRANLGLFHVRPDYSDLSDRKREVKELLFRSGIIGSPDKPLFLYVGRLSREKGIDILPHLANQVVERHNGQIVIMGVPTDRTIQGLLTRLQNQSQDSKYQGLIRYYDNLKRDQLDVLPGTSVQKGLLLRFAADFTVVPSIEESCGLVPIEAFAMGSGVFTSLVHGLKDLCQPLIGFSGFPNGVGPDQFTCFPFKRTATEADTLANLDSSLTATLRFWDSLSPAQKLVTQIRWIQKSKEFEWERGSLDEYYRLYLKAIGAFSQNEIQEKQRLKNVFFETYERTR